MTDTADTSLRMDKWLWYIRFFKSRTLAGAFCSSGKVRLNGRIVRKPKQTVRPNDVLTFPLGGHIRVIRVVNLGRRRGPATEARALYENLSPPPPVRKQTGSGDRIAVRDAGTGRPTKAQRRATDRLRNCNVRPD